MTQVFNEDIKIERNGSPRLAIESHGYGAQHYSIRVTNNRDGEQSGPTGPEKGRKFIIRNENFLNPDQTRGKDLLIIDHRGNVEVTVGDIRLSGADCAEDFDTREIESVEPGSVMVATEGGRLQQSFKAYDKGVIGVVSGAGNYQPGIILGQQKKSPENRLPIALMGKVYCKVDADQAAIEVGDLLTTSPTQGHAMKVLDPIKAFGTVIGKALGALDAGKGMIPILVALQ